MSALYYLDDGKGKHTGLPLQHIRLTIFCSDFQIFLSRRRKRLLPDKDDAAKNKKIAELDAVGDKNGQVEALEILKKYQAMHIDWGRGGGSIPDR